MSDIISITATGRLTKDPEVRAYGNDKSLTSFSIACTQGFKDNIKTVFLNCSAFGKIGEAIAKYFKKGDGIVILGEFTTNKKDDKVYHGVIVKEFVFGQKHKDSSGTSQPESPQESNPFSDEEIPF